MERRAVLAVLAVLAMGCWSARAEAMGCMNSTGSSGRLQVRCAQWQTVEGVSDLCSRAGNVAVTLILYDIRHFARDTANISALTAETLPGDVACIHHLRISTSSFRRLTVDFAFTMMRKLMVRYTDLSAFPQINRYQGSLTLLNLSHNQIDSIVISDLTRQTTPALQVLDLSYNRLTNLPRNAFSHLTNLLVLDLSHNLVEAVQPWFVGNLLSLKKLTLSNNRIRQLPENSLRVSDSVHPNMNLAGNPLETVHQRAMTIFLGMNLTVDTKHLHCDCDALLLYGILGVVHGLAPTCGSPAILVGRTLESVTPEQLTCSAYATYSTQAAEVAVEAGSPIQMACNFAIAGGDYQPADVEVMWLRGVKEVPGTQMPLPTPSLPSPLHRRRKRFSDFWDIFDMLAPPQTQYEYSMAVLETPKVADNYTSTLTFHNTTFSDTGEYYCQLHLSAKFFRSPVTSLMITEAVRIASVVRSSSTHLGQNVTILCNVSGMPIPAVIWQRQGEGNDLKMLTINDAKFANVFDRWGSFGSSVIHRLTLLNVTAEYSGKYICDAYNSGGHARGSVQISVKEPPAVEIVASSLEVQVGEALIVQCTARGTPPFDFTWLQFAGKRIGYIPIKPLEANSQPQLASNGNVSTLFYMRLPEEGRRRFACSARNEVGSQNKTVVIRIRNTDVKPVTTTAPPTSVEAVATTTAPLTSGEAVTLPSVSPTNAPDDTVVTDKSPEPTVDASGVHSGSATDFFKIPFFITIGIALTIVFLLMAVLVQSQRKRPQTKS